MRENRVSSGCEVFDQLLEGGFEKDTISTIYGPSTSGKTCLCLLATISAAEKGKSVIFIDTEGGFSIERMKQLAPNYKELLKKVLFFKPTNFKEQKEVFKQLSNAVNDNISIVIVDTIAMLYRLELGKNDEVYSINRELGTQISYLTEIARKKNIPVLLTNQVYSSFDERNRVKMVGGDIIKYASKCLVELQVVGKNRRAVLRNHRSLPEEKNIMFKIANSGIQIL